MNIFKCINTVYLHSSKIIEIVLVSNQSANLFFYTYNYDNVSFRVFKSYLSLIDFFKGKNEADYHFNTKEELDNFFSKVILNSNLSKASSNEIFNLRKILYPIIKILREETNGTYEYSYDNDLVIIQNKDELFRIPIHKFQENASILLNVLQQKTPRTFGVPVVEEFLASFNCSSVKAKSSVKSDINIVIHDQRMSTNSSLGFSIKSQLGSSSTLFNAGRTTNFIFKIEQTVLSKEMVHDINSIGSRTKIKDRIAKIIEAGGQLKFVKTEKRTLGNNLTLIDSQLPAIMAAIIYKFYTSSLTKIVDLVQVIRKENPLNYDLSSNHPFYTYKIKRLLTDMALGMMASKVWTGQYDATGGYLIVKKDGDVLCYHIYNKNEFEDYLFRNTKLETASSSRHKFGSIYTLDRQQYFNLNLQIRFRE